MWTVVHTRGLHKTECLLWDQWILPHFFFAPIRTGLAEAIASATGAEKGAGNGGQTRGDDRWRISSSGPEAAVWLSIFPYWTQSFDFAFLSYLVQILGINVKQELISMNALHFFCSDMPAMAFPIYILSPFFCWYFVQTLPLPGLSNIWLSSFDCHVGSQFFFP